MAPRSSRVPRSGCPVATTLDMVGDRWTLVIVRDLLLGRATFGEFLASPERIATNVLADRLALLERHGLAERVAYQGHPPRYRYRLTAKGRALRPILQEMCRWANRHVPGTWTPPPAFMAAHADDAPDRQE
jgi:DNA-binding HxlR family transcriptional regulator